MKKYSGSVTEQRTHQIIYFFSLLAQSNLEGSHPSTQEYPHPLYPQAILLCVYWLSSLFSWQTDGGRKMHALRIQTVFPLLKRPG